LNIAKDIRIQPCKTYIPFYRKNQFALLTKTKNDAILLGLNLPENHSIPKFSSKSAKGSVRINAQTVIQCKSDFNENVQAALRIAYKEN